MKTNRMVKLPEEPGVIPKGKEKGKDVSDSASDIAFFANEK